MVSRPCKEITPEKTEELQCRIIANHRFKNTGNVKTAKTLSGAVVSKDQNLQVVNLKESIFNIKENIMKRTEM